VVREVAGQEHCIGLRPHRTNRLDRRGESAHGLVVEPLRTDVRIAQLREEKGAARAALKNSGDESASSTSNSRGASSTSASAARCRRGTGA
jgi:hypothetical protein